MGVGSGVPTCVLRAHLCGSGVGSGVTTWCSGIILMFRDHLDVQGIILMFRDHSCSGIILMFRDHLCGSGVTT